MEFMPAAFALFTNSISSTLTRAICPHCICDLLEEVAVASTNPSVKARPIAKDGDKHFARIGKRQLGCDGARSSRPSWCMVKQVP